ncbi:peptide/nickel transport system permease protein [Cribrihabitans marinus]|uniref:Peptide/nickel transport system permease protein n=1 Tax=Cribrihabitans marinus TaxID=1227549 RepID=A0A1H7DSB4_9RHOB|nr:ABC transporter permease [Cribrihabitans marinus]GGH40004.1 glutathione ABC transporter permease GsiC [Cribrihabitans marinus]SEK04623.1 peptide/nickel transport system permease protein [Cribrihabitans marinus]
MTRSRYILKRLLQTIPLIAGIMVLVMLLLHVVPGDPARAIGGMAASDETVEQIREELGLNRSFVAQYIAYVGNALQGDLGISTRSRQPVTEIIGERLAPTLWLLTAGMILSIVLASAVSVLAARNKDRAADYALGGLTVIGLSMPAYWVGIMLLLLVALPTGAFPISGFGKGFWGHLNAIILPALTFAIAISPVMIRALRAKLVALYRNDFVMMSRAVGLSESTILARHLSRHAALVLITMVSVQVGPMIFVGVVIEKTFALPGLGQALVNAVAQRDFPVVQGITLTTALFVTFVHLGADIFTSFVNPRTVLE